MKIGSKVKLTFFFSYFGWESSLNDLNDNWLNCHLILLFFPLPTNYHFYPIPTPFNKFTQPIFSFSTKQMKFILFSILSFFYLPTKHAWWKVKSFISSHFFILFTFSIFPTKQSIKVWTQLFYITSSTIYIFSWFSLKAITPVNVKYKKWWVLHIFAKKISISVGL